MSDPYLHGTSESEQSRLALMNGLLNASELELIGLHGDERVLEMGAGTGVFARDLAEAVPQGTILGIEYDPEQLEAAQETCAGHPHVELRRGDAYDPPLSGEEWGSFDLVHARFLLEHLTDPERALGYLVRAAKPGGRIVLVDDDLSLMRLWPEPEHFVALRDDHIRRYRSLGMDGEIGCRLVELLAGAGAAPERVTQLFYGACSGDPRFPDYVDNLARVMEISHGDDDDPRLAAWVEELRQWGRGDGRAIWYGLPMAIARRP